MSLTGFGTTLRMNLESLEVFPFSTYWKNLYKVWVISSLNDWENSLRRSYICFVERLLITNLIWTNRQRLSRFSTHFVSLILGEFVHIQIFKLMLGSLLYHYIFSMFAESLMIRVLFFFFFPFLMVFFSFLIDFLLGVYQLS